MSEVEEDEDTRVCVTEVLRLTRRELRFLAVQIVTRKTYLVWAGDDERMHDSFAFMLRMVDVTAVMHNIGAAYAPMSAAMPLAVNGRPMMTSIQFLHIKDVEKLDKRVRRLRRRLRSE